MGITINNGEVMDGGSYTGYKIAGDGSVMKSGFYIGYKICSDGKS